MILFPLFAIGVADTGGKFAAGIIDTGGNLLPLSTTPAYKIPWVIGLNALIEVTNDFAGFAFLKRCCVQCTPHLIKKALSVLYEQAVLRTLFLPYYNGWTKKFTYFKSLLNLLLFIQ
jgi:hypothetical protein